MSEAILTYGLHNRGEYSIIVNKRSRMRTSEYRVISDWGRAGNGGKV